MDSTLAALGALLQFSSMPYLVILALAVCVHFALPGPRTRAVWLLLLSAGFYLALSPRTFGLLLAVAAVSWVAGLAIEGAARTGTTGSDRLGRVLTVVTVVALVAGLVAAKYLGFLAEVGNGALSLAGLGATLPVLKLALPLGISFWTFQAIAYVVDVRRGTCAAVRDPLMYLLAVSFFPIVTSGPITRVQDLAGQLSVRHRFDHGGMRSGLLLIGRGFFKKLMVADRLAVFVQAVFADPHAVKGSGAGTVMLTAALLFSIQLYCDFSGYTDIVRGSARLFGVELPVNFRAPYLSRSVREFWRRWHVTLMDWFREYIYIPLGGSRAGTARRWLNLLVVFAVSGLWHGAGITYLVWGLLNGAYQIAGQALAPLRDRVVAVLRIDRDAWPHRLLQTLVTFALITAAWVFFRAASVSDALYMLSRMAAPSLRALTDGTLLGQGLSAPQLAVAALSAAAVFGAEWLGTRRDVLAGLVARPLVVRWAAYGVLVMTVVVFGAYGGAYRAADFLYFKY